MIIEYTVSDHTFAKRQLIAARDRKALLSPGRYYGDTLILIAYFFLGAGSGFAAGVCYGSLLFHLAGFFLSVEAFRRAFYWRPYGRWLHNIVFPATLSKAQRPVRLEFLEDGMREHRGDVVSFAPWKDLESAFIEDDLLVLILSSKQEAVIPRESPGISTLNLEEIRDAVERRREQAKTAPSAGGEAP